MCCQLLYESVGDIISLYNFRLLGNNVFWEVHKIGKQKQ